MSPTTNMETTEFSPLASPSNSTASSPRGISAAEQDWESDSSSQSRNESSSSLMITDCSSSGDEAEDAERPYVPGCFEGPEKTLEVCFKPGTGKDPMGCRAMTRAQLDKLCKQARCTILNQISNNHQDAYLLSESSLFVWPYKIMLKTCGTTTLLRCIPTLLQFTNALGLELEWVGYSRKNYSFPGDQYFPHSSFEQELSYLKSHSKLCSRLNGSGYVLGPMSGDHWFVYVADKCSRPSYEYHDRVLNVMMFDMDPEVARLFYKENVGSAEEMTKVSGIGALVPGANIDAFAFEPCGYSMNAIAYGNYATVHITPEAECSYASFETNTPLKSYDSLINNVLRVFRPKRFVLTMFADEAALDEMNRATPFEKQVRRRASRS